jgi:hypothetical protein
MQNFSREETGYEVVGDCTRDMFPEQSQYNHHIEEMPRAPLRGACDRSAQSHWYMAGASWHEQNLTNQ